MNLKLTRVNYLSTGIFSLLEPYEEHFTFWVAEHAYAVSPPVSYHEYYLPKLPLGIYKCVRGIHRLKNMDKDFVTFEVTGVPDHTGILFHVGNNPQTESIGCLLLGLEKDRDKLVLHSRTAFKKFMEKQKDCNEFMLEVV